MQPVAMSSGELTPSRTMTPVGVAIVQSWLQPTPASEAIVTSMAV
jgi:hypothetical protein